MKQTCSNCTHSRLTYKGRYCVANNKRKMVRLADSCEKWRAKDDNLHASHR